MTRYVLAISGGVDSVVMLDMMSKNTNDELIVAHFDHGIRDDSVDDAKFVGELAKKYGLKFETKREELGKNASEELARNRRYKFLRSVAKKYDAKLVTAHHSDDVVESIVINLIRGTGWRGLAVMDSDVYRPLWDKTKQEIMEYAKDNKLEWHEDNTNNSDKYLRNRVRRQLVVLNVDSKRQLLTLWMNQKMLKQQIEQENKKLIGPNKLFARHLFICIDEQPAIELLREVTGGKLTRPQLANLLVAIKTMPAGKKFEAGNGVIITFTSRNFTVELVK